MKATLPDAGVAPVGATGDLTKRLMIPALYNLSRTQQQKRNDVH
jgi:glucose-6-phosphate 1-dehydrogenase